MQLHVNKEARATHMTGLESFQKKMIAGIPKEMRAQVEPAIKQMATGAKEIALWNNRIYQFAGQEVEMNVPHSHEVKMPHPMGGEIDSVNTITIKPSSACPTEQCVLIEDISKADPKSLGKAMEGIMKRMFDSMKEMMKKNGNKKKPPKLKFGASKMIMTTKIVMDPSTMTIFKVEFLRDVDMDMGELGHAIMKEIHDDQYTYPSVKK